MGKIGKGDQKVQTSNYKMQVNNVGLNCTGPLKCRFFKITSSRVNCVFHCGWESMDADGRLKLYVDFWLQGWSALLTPTLFNGQF